jgi:hypothetical protein
MKWAGHDEDILSHASQPPLPYFYSMTINPSVNIIPSV